MTQRKRAGQVVRVVRTLAIALILVIVSGRPAAAQEAHEGEDAGAQAHEEGSHGAFRNEVALFLGNTRKSNHNALTVGLLRVGATYVFHFGPEGRWGIAPQAFLDVVEGQDAWVLGFAFGYLF